MKVTLDTNVLVRLATQDDPVQPAHGDHDYPPNLQWITRL